MSRCYQCDARISGQGYRRWVRVGNRSFASVGRSFRSIRVGGGSSTGLRTLCVDCVTQMDAPPDPRVVKFWVCLFGLIVATVLMYGDAWRGGLCVYGLVFAFMIAPLLGKFVAWRRQPRAPSNGPWGFLLATVGSLIAICIVIVVTLAIIAA